MSRAFPLPFRRAFPSSRRSFPRPFFIQNTNGTKIVRVAILLDSGKRHVSFDGASTTDGPTDADLLGVSTITREIGIFGGGYRAGTFTITLKNNDRKWQQIKASEPVRNREIRVYFHSKDDPAQRIPPVVVGRIDMLELAGTEAQLLCHDSAFDNFNQPLSSRLLIINSDNFPYLPEEATYNGQLAPVYYAGDTTPIPAYGANLQFPAYLIDPAIGQAKYRYLIAQHPVASTALTADYVRVEGGNWAGYPTGATLTTAVYGGVTCSVLDFDGIQQPTGQPLGAEVVSHRLPGAINPPPSGSTISTPVNALYRFLIDYTPFGDSYPGNAAGGGGGKSLASGNPTEAALAATSENQKLSMWIGGDPNQTFLDVISGYQDSFPAVFFASRFGTFGLAHWTMVGSRTSTLEHSAQTGHVQVTENDDIAAGSFRLLNPEETASQTRIFYDRHVVDERFVGSEVDSNATFETYLSEVKESLRSAVYMQADVSAISDTLLALLSPLNNIFEFRIPAHWWSRVDIDKLIQVTHREIPSSLLSEMKADSATAIYRLAESERLGTVAYDASSSALNGTYIGRFSSVDGLLIGDSNKAVLLQTSSNGYVDCPTTAFNPTGVSSWTAEAILRPSSAVSGTYILGRYDNVSRDGIYIDLLASSGSVYFHAARYKTGVLKSEVFSTTVAQPGRRAHLMVTYDGVNLRLYLDGILQATGANDSNSIPAVTPLPEIGNADGGSNSYDGIIDETAFYASCLSSARARPHYLSGLARYSPTVVARIIGLELNLNPAQSDLIVRALQVKTSLAA